VAGSYDADDVAAAWNSCMRLSCLKHGATVHTQFDLVPPYPKFEPRIRYAIALLFFLVSSVIFFLYLT
jgi:hypothetical protein